MNCEEFEAIGLDAGTGRVTPAEEAAAAEHASKCAKCAALAESWDVARSELAVLAAVSKNAEAPARVQMHLLQELRAQKRPLEIYRRTGMIVGWGLAAAAVLVGVISWRNWVNDRPHAGVAKNRPVSVATVSPEYETILVADEDNGAFTPLPGAIPIALEDAAIYQLRMQRASLGALGLPVNEDGASDWINVDLLVAVDGTPQGVRLHEDSANSATLQQF